MQTGEKKESQGELFERRLDTLLDKCHRLVKLRERVNWRRFDGSFGELYSLENGRPALRTRLLVGLTLLKYLHDLSDDETLELWVENPYWQYFCGEEYFRHELPCHGSSLSRWRKRIGERGAVELLDESLAVVREAGLLKMSYLKEVYVDTTVQEKNVAYPSDANLLHRARLKLVKLAKAQALVLRQSYTRKSKVLMIKAHKYAAARQFNRARRAVKKLRTLLGRVVRDIERKVTEGQKPYFTELLQQARQLLNSAEGLAPKLYSLHEPHVEAIAKGKVHKRFEFGVKVSVVATRKLGFVLGCKAIHGNPYDGHTLEEALKDVESRLGAKLYVASVGVDLGYRGHGIKDSRFRVFHPKLKRLSQKQRRFIRARSRIESSISLLKRCFRLGKNYLKGKLGDCMNALFAGAASNLAIFLRTAPA